MHPFYRALVLTLAAGFVAGCSGGAPSTVSTLPFVDATHAGIPVPGTSHIYVADQSSATVLGYAYAAANIGNSGPNCTVGTQPTNIATDGTNNLIEIAGISISVYGPAWCGNQIGATLSDPYGKAQDAASNNAVKGEIAVAMFDGPGNGSLAICTLYVHPVGCHHNYTNPAMTQEARGVVMTNHGDCFVSSSTYTSPVLVYFAQCRGSGVVATGFTNTSAGGLDIDSHGNLVAIDPNASEVWVYRGCPACVNLTGSPLSLSAGSALYAHLNVNSKLLAAADTLTSSIDVYYYTSSATAASLTYWHSFNTGLIPGVWGVAWLPRSRQ
jgi:hypothetical protein